MPMMRSLVRLAFVTAAASSLALAGRAAAQDEVADLWNDPTFQRQFVGGYGVNAEIEPRVTPEEAAILEKVLPLMAKDLPRAEATLREQMKPKCSAVLDLTLGGIQFQQNHLDAALASFQEAVHKFPSFHRAWRNLGLLHMSAQRYDDAIKAFTRMIVLGGADGYSFGMLGFAYASKEDYQAAETAYRNALLLQPDSTDWRLGLTRCVFKQEKYEDAATLLDALIARYPDKADFWLLQARTFVGMKQPLRAAQNFEAVDRLGKSTPDSLNALGDIYVNENLMDLAANAYERAIDADAKQSLDRPLRAAETLAARGALPQAREVAQHLQSARGGELPEADRRKLLKLEARIAMADGSGSAETVAVLEQIVALDPLDGEALMLFGQHYAAHGEPDRAILYYERAGSLDAFEANAKVREATVLAGLARYSDAMPLLRRAQELKPREDVARYLEQVERLSKSKR